MLQTNKQADRQIPRVYMTYLAEVVKINSTVHPYHIFYEGTY